MSGFNREVKPYICGKRGGRAYLDAYKTTDGVCNIGEPCSARTTGSNTICMREAEKASGLCPITDIRISIGEAAYDDYTQVPLTDTLTLVYTKELVNSKPITTTSVEY